MDNANGNRVTYAYDPENRPISMHNYTGSRYTYAYWADGLRRYAQEPSSPIVTQIWDGQDLLMEKSPTGTARYIAHEGEVFGEKRGDTRYLYLPDPLGSVVALLDNAQTITDSFIYLPYGEEQVRTGSTTSNLRWLGRWGYRRDYTNRAYVRARVMRTDFGKWMMEDPLGFDAGDVNLYRYVAGNPMTAVDPGGRSWLDDRYKDIEKAILCPGVGVEQKRGRVPCPPEVGAAKRAICAALGRIGRDGLVELGKGVVTGPKQAQCLLDWCNRDTSIYCHSESRCNEKGGCAWSCSTPGAQHPDWVIHVCYGRAAGGRCHFGCMDPLKESILHEMIGVCGTTHGPGLPVLDICNWRATRLCDALGL